MGQRWGDCQKPLRDAASCCPSLLQRHRVLHANTLFSHSQRREKQPSCHKKPQTLEHARTLHSLREGPSAPTPQHCSTYCRMNWMASSYFIPLSIKASATRTGALKGKSSGCHSPVTQPKGSYPSFKVQGEAQVADPPHEQLFSLKFHKTLLKEGLRKGRRSTGTVVPLLLLWAGGSWDKTLLKVGLGKGRRKAGMVFPLLHL